MTKTEQRIAIAEFCGWKRVDPFKCGKEMVDWPVWERDGKRASLKSNNLPNYPEDLNLMRDAEKLFMRPEDNEDDSGLLARYQEALASVLQIDKALFEVGSHVDLFYRFIHASSEQRADAFVSVIVES